MKHTSDLMLVLLATLLGLSLFANSCSEEEVSGDGDSEIPQYHPPNTSDGDFITDGDAAGDTDFSPVDGDDWDSDTIDIPSDGDISDGDLIDGDQSDSDAIDGDMTDGDLDGNDIPDGDVAPDGDDTEQDADPVLPSFCHSHAQCPSDLICNYSLGRCERRSSWLDTVPEIFGFHPLAGAPGDVLTIDGKRFYANVWGSTSVQITIGQTTISGFTAVATGENRILVNVPSGASGLISVLCEGNLLVTSSESFSQAPTGVITCDGSTPAASMTPSSTLGETGPYAAGYLDMSEHQARLFYPAACGSIRRPAIPGTYPLIVLLHGNGAAYINLEYLGQFFATWGFVSVMPATPHNNEYDPEAVRIVHDLLEDVQGQTLDDIHPALTGVSTTTELIMLGHSRGCARMQNVYEDHPDIEASSLASIFVGPHDEGYNTPGPFMVFGATEDYQSAAFIYNAAYNLEADPKWKIVVQGGNHGSFCDAKVYTMFDGEPSVTRRQQMQIVTSYTLPFVQRAFGQAEPFAQQLDSPPQSPLTEVEYEL